MRNIWKEMHLEYPDVVMRTQISDGTENVLIHSHNFYELIFVIKGEIQYLLDGKRFRIQPGDIILIPPTIIHQPLFPEPLAEPYERFVLWMDLPFWERCVEEHPDMNFAFCQCQKRNSYLLRSPRPTWTGLFVAANLLNNEFNKKQLGWETIAKAMTLSLMVHINRTYYYQDISFPDAEKANLMDDICLYITSNLSKRLTLESVAQHFLVSKSTICHMFSKQFHVSFYQWIIHQRLITAKNGILSGVPLKDLWEDCGFSDYSSFYRSFKKEFGVCPKEFQKRF